MEKLQITVCIPTIPSRSKMLQLAVKSVLEQTHPAAAIAIAVDKDRQGAWVTRNRTIGMSNTEWTTFLDDDDQMMPHHLQHLVDCVFEHKADIVSSWFKVMGGTDPFPTNRGRKFDPELNNCVPIPYMVRTDLLRQAVLETGGFQPDPPGHGSWWHQDRPLFAKLVELGGVHFASREETWYWYHHGKNTAGLPNRN